MCDRNCVSDAGRVPDLSASPGAGEGAGEGCLLDQLVWEETWGWGWGPGRLLPWPRRGVGGQDGDARLGCAGAGGDRPQWLLPSGGPAWGRWV